MIFCASFGIGTTIQMIFSWSIACECMCLVTHRRRLLRHIGFRLTVEGADESVKRYVCRDFYVDDGLSSVPTSEEAVKLLKKTQSVLMDEGKIRLA